MIIIIPSWRELILDYDKLKIEVDLFNSFRDRSDSSLDGSIFQSLEYVQSTLRMLPFRGCIWKLGYSWWLHLLDEPWNSTFVSRTQWDCLSLSLLADTLFWTSSPVFLHCSWFSKCFKGKSRTYFWFYFSDFPSLRNFWPSSSGFLVWCFQLTLKFLYGLPSCTRRSVDLLQVSVCTARNCSKVFLWC